MIDFFFLSNGTDCMCYEFREKRIQICVVDNAAFHYIQKKYSLKILYLFIYVGVHVCVCIIISFKFLIDFTLLISFDLYSNLDSRYNRHYYHNLHIRILRTSGDATCPRQRSQLWLFFFLILRMGLLQMYRVIVDTLRKMVCSTSGLFFFKILFHKKFS